MNEPCQHVMHILVNTDQLTVEIDIDPDEPLQRQLDAIRAVVEGLLQVRAQCIQLHAMRN